MEKFVMLTIKRTIPKFAAHMLAKKYMNEYEIEKDESDEPSDLTSAIMNFLLKLLTEWGFCTS